MGDVIVILVHILHCVCRCCILLSSLRLFMLCSITRCPALGLAVAVPVHLNIKPARNIHCRHAFILGRGLHAALIKSIQGEVVRASRSAGSDDI